MRVPLEITSRNVDLTDDLNELIREKAKKLDAVFENIISCRVMIDMPHRSQQSGSAYNVRIEMTIPGGELVVKREPHADLFVAISKTFEIASRQLKEHASRQRGDVKVHMDMERLERPSACVSELFPEEGYGFLTTLDGRQVYFHENSVQGAKFKNLKVGAQVSFVEVEGDKGPMANTISME